MPNTSSIFKSPVLCAVSALFLMLSLPAAAQKYSGKDKQIVEYLKQADSLEEVNIDQALKVFKQVENRALKTGDKEALMFAYAGRGSLYTNSDRYVESNKEMIEAIKIADELGNDNTSIRLRLRQAQNFFMLENYKLIVQMHNEIAEKIAGADSLLLLRYNSSRARLANAQKKFPEALVIYKENLVIAEALKSKAEISFAAYYVALTHFGMGNCEEARKYMLKTIAIDEELKEYYNLMNNYELLAAIELECLFKPEEGLKTLARLEELFRLYDINNSRYNLYHLYYKAYKLKGDYKLALEYYEKEMVIKDSTFSVDEKTMLADMENKYQTERKQAEINLQKKVIASEKNNSRLAYAGLVLAGLMLAGTGYGFYSTRRYNKLIAAREQHKELLLREVHHRINNSLQLISSLMNFQARSSASSDVKEVLHQTEMRVHSMAAMHDLLNVSNSPVYINIRTYLDQVLAFHRQVLNDKGNLSLTADIDDAMLPSKIALPVALMLNEMVTNAVKYGFPGDRPGQITVKVKQQSPGNWIF
ncbi:MAG: histidine kinase dimerization/phosphoacceptor domain -containing protein, partial [Bacteroidota bacterium]